MNGLVTVEAKSSEVGAFMVPVIAIYVVNVYGNVFVRGFTYYATTITAIPRIYTILAVLRSYPPLFLSLVWGTSVGLTALYLQLVLLATKRVRPLVGEAVDFRRWLDGRVAHLTLPASNLPESLLSLPILDFVKTGLATNMPALSSFRTRYACSRKRFENLVNGVFMKAKTSSCFSTIVAFVVGFLDKVFIYWFSSRHSRRITYTTNMNNLGGFHAPAI